MDRGWRLCPHLGCSYSIVADGPHELPVAADVKGDYLVDDKALEVCAARSWRRCFFVGGGLTLGSGVCGRAAAVLRQQEAAAHGAHAAGLHHGQP